MDVIDKDWILARLSDERGEKADLARAMGIDQMKLTKILSGSRKVQAEEIPSVVEFFSQKGRAAPELVDLRPGEQDAEIIKKFRSAFLEALETTGWSMPEVARRAGVSRYQLDKLKQREGGTTNVDDARLVANAFGYTLDEFLGDSLAHDRETAAALWRQLTPKERHLIKVAAEAPPAPGLEVEK